MRIHLNIGSNIGDRHNLLRQAVRSLSCIWPDARIALSPIVESEPWGYSSANRFLNIGVMIDLPRALAPEQVLDITQSIERAVADAPHRHPDGSYCDRPIDIDIIDIDGLSLHTPRLTLPHPRAHLRSFVLEPLRALDPPTASRLAAED